MGAVWFGAYAVGHQELEATEDELWVGEAGGKETAFTVNIVLLGCLTRRNLGMIFGR